MSELKRIKVEEFTTPNPTCVEGTTGLKQIFELMVNDEIRHVLVLDKDGQVSGLLSERDVLTHSQSENFSELTAEQVMTKNLLRVSPNMKIYEVALEMSKNKIGSAVVCEETSDYVGIFTVTDALNALVELVRGDFDLNNSELPL